MQKRRLQTFFFAFFVKKMSKHYMYIHIILYLCIIKHI